MDGKNFLNLIDPIGKQRNKYFATVEAIKKAPVESIDPPEALFEHLFHTDLPAAGNAE
jgi:hypothetical protein